MTDTIANSTSKERLFLRQWIGKNVRVHSSIQGVYSGCLTNIVFDGNRLMYIMLDDKRCINFDHIVEISLS
jgi:RNase P/RNase MRP subunit p29